MNLLPFQLPPFIRVVTCPIVCFPAKWHPRWRARVVERLLCCCDYRVVLRCSSHPPRAGGKITKLDPRGSGPGFAGRLGSPGVRQRVPAHSDRTGGALCAHPGRVVRKPLCKPRGGLHPPLSRLSVAPAFLLSCYQQPLAARSKSIGAQALKPPPQGLLALKNSGTPCQ